MKEATTLHTAEAHKLSLDVIRDETCWTRTYTIDTEITVETVYYEQEACRGPSVTKSETLARYIVAADTNFAYYTTDNVPLSLPIDDLRGVTRVDWNMTSNVSGWKNALTYFGSSVYTGTVGTTGTGDQVLQASRASLTVTTGAAEGKASPVLSWSDPNPAGYVESWVLFRAANPEGTPTTDPDRGMWQQVGPTFPVAVTSWTDTTLPAGHTASYVVRPMLSDGSRGPESNWAVTGLRPVAPTGLTVTGRATSLVIKWDSAVGATGYDVYRDGVLFAHTTALTYTDGPGEHGWTGSGFSHAHYVCVVGVNRWESLTTTGAQSGVVALGATMDQVFPRIGATSVATTAVGGFTAPAAPTITATPTTSWTNVKRPGFDAAPV